MVKKQIESKPSAEHAEEVVAVIDPVSYLISPCGESVDVKGMAARSAALKASSVEIGAQRVRFLSKLSKAPDGMTPILTVKYGSSSVSITKTLGALVEPENRTKLAQHPSGVHASLSTAPHGSAPANKKIGSVVIPCGVCLIVAAGGTGKTPLAHALASHGVDTYSVVRVGEPLAGYASSTDSVAYSLAVAMIENSNVVLDSIKDLLSSGGAAMKSGLSRDALVSISGWASAACEAGCTIYVPVNPSTPDVEVLELLAEAARSNATMAIISTGAKSWGFSARQGESLQRTTGTLLLDYTPTGLASVKFSGTTGVSESGDEVSRHIASIVSVSAISAAHRRALSTQED